MANVLGQVSGSSIPGGGSLYDWVSANYPSTTTDTTTGKGTTSSSGTTSGTSDTSGTSAWTTGLYNYDALNKQASDLAASNMAGTVSPELQRTFSQQAAERGVGGGNLGSVDANYMLRYLGGSLGLQTLGEQQYANLLNVSPRTTTTTGKTTTSGTQSTSGTQDTSGSTTVDQAAAKASALASILAAQQYLGAGMQSGGGRSALTGGLGGSRYTSPTTYGSTSGGGLDDLWLGGSSEGVGLPGLGSGYGYTPEQAATGQQYPSVWDTGAGGGTDETSNQDAWWQGYA